MQGGPDRRRQSDAINGFKIGWGELACALAFDDPEFGSNPVFGLGEIATTATGIAHGFDEGRLAARLTRPLAVLRLSRRFSPTRVEAACALALRGPIRSPRYAHLRPILDTGQDKTGHVPDKPEADDGGYVRGSAYYAGGVRVTSPGVVCFRSS